MKLEHIAKIIAMDYAGDLPVDNTLYIEFYEQVEIEIYYTGFYFWSN